VLKAGAGYIERYGPVVGLGGIDSRPKELAQVLLQPLFNGFPGCPNVVSVQRLTVENIAAGHLFK